MKSQRLAGCVRSAKNSFLLCLAALALAACGGGGGTQLVSGGIVGTGDSALVSSGAITAVGASRITVNAIQFATANAVVTLNGHPDAAGALKLGMVVTVQGLANADGTATAARISYQADVQGVVSGVDNAARSFVVLGQNVRTNSLTVFDGGSFATLVNQYVEVSGFRSTPGELLAARVEVRPQVVSGASLEVTGIIAALDPVARTFAIGMQVVDYSQVASAFLPSGLANGVTMRAIGTLTNSDGRLVATGVAVVAVALPAAESTKVELEGLVANHAGLASFTVNGQAVDARNAVFSGGTAADLVNGAKVQVGGRIVDGIVIATRIEFEAGVTATFDGTAQMIDAGAGTLVVAGQTFVVNATTQFEDKSAAALTSFALASLHVGDRVNIKAARTASSYLALRIERLDLAAPPEAAPTAKTEGTIANFVSIASFDVGARRVNASSARIVNGTAADLANGRRVEVEGVLSGATLMASRVGFAIETTLPPATVSIEGTIADFVSRASFSVAGQRVDASGASFENGSAADLANGRVVEVKGLASGATVVASNVSFRAAPAEATLEIEGRITDYVSNASFRVGGQSVDASRAQFKNGSISDLANGRRVHVKGALAGAVLKATMVEFEDAATLEGASAKGKVTDFVSIANFKVAGRSIDASAARFEGGTAADLRNGKEVEVDGTLVGAILKAARVAFD
jgi:hypothetical protein